MNTLEDRVLDRMHEATARGALRWSTDTTDGNREIWRSECAGEELRVELLYVKRATGDSFERFAFEVVAFGLIFTAGIGSNRYDTIVDMLSFSMTGWRDARAASERRAMGALSMLDALLGEKE